MDESWDHRTALNYVRAARKSGKPIENPLRKIPKQRSNSIPQAELQEALKEVDKSGPDPEAETVPDPAPVFEPEPIAEPVPEPEPLANGGQGRTSIFIGVLVSS